MINRDGVGSLRDLRVDDLEFVSRETDGLDRGLGTLVFVDVEAVIGMGHAPVPGPGFRDELNLNEATVLGILETGSRYVADKVGILQLLTLALQCVLSL